MKKVVWSLIACLVVWPAAAQTPSRGVLAAAGAVHSADVQGQGTASITISGTFTGTVAFEVVAGPGSAAVTVDCATPGNPSSAVNSTTAAGVWVCPVAGMTLLQARLSSYSNGAAQVDIVAALAAGQTVGGAGGGGGGEFDGVLRTPNGDSAMDESNDASRVNCIAGCSGGTSDTDDGSIAGSQATGLALALNQAWDGSVWRRVTFGVAGTPSAQVTTIQGVSGMTAVQVAQSGSWSLTANAGTNLNTSALLTTSAHDAAFGSAGSADAQVRTVQGIASMTPLQVQSNSANLATESTLGNVLTSSTFNAAFGTAGSADAQVLSVQGIASGTPLAVNVAQIGGGSVAASACDDPAKVTSVAISTGTSGNTQLVALNGSEVVYACGLVLMAGGTVDVSVVYGTGTNCGTGETALTGAFPLVAQTGFSVPNGTGVQFKGAAGNAMCLKLSASQNVRGWLTYVRQ